MTRLAVVLFLVAGSFAADKQMLVTKTVEDDNSLSGGCVFRMLAEDDSSTYELACSLKKGVSTPAVDKRYLKDFRKISSLRIRLAVLSPLGKNIP